MGVETPPPEISETKKGMNTKSLPDFNIYKEAQIKI